jgi:hypothetical protein
MNRGKENLFLLPGIGIFGCRFNSFSNKKKQVVGNTRFNKNVEASACSPKAKAHVIMAQLSTQPSA